MAITTAKLKVRRDTSTNWSSTNPTLDTGEIGYETDTYRFKIGDGTSAWDALEYFTAGVSGQGTSISSYITAEAVTTNDVAAVNSFGKATIASKDDSGKVNVVGFFKSSKGSGEAVDVQKVGLMYGFTGLTAGLPVYLANGGAVSQDPDNDILNGEFRVFLGIAKSDTVIDIWIGEPFDNDAIFTHPDQTITTGNSVHGISLSTIYPIGSTYTQLPGKNNPTDLGLPGTWSNISSSFAGDFLRVEGGNASAFEAGEQADSTAVNGLGVNDDTHNHSASSNDDTHNHSGSANSNGDHDHSSKYLTGNAGDPSGGSTVSYVHAEEGDWGVQFKVSSNIITNGDHGHTLSINNDTHNHSITVNNDTHNHGLSGDTETRPINKTIRIWERTS